VLSKLLFIITVVSNVKQRGVLITNHQIMLTSDKTEKKQNQCHIQEEGKSILNTISSALVNFWPTKSRN